MEVHIKARNLVKVETVTCCASKDMGVKGPIINPNDPGDPD